MGTKEKERQTQEQCLAEKFGNSSFSSRPENITDIYLPYTGQLGRYMDDFHWKYGFFSTYNELYNFRTELKYTQLFENGNFLNSVDYFLIDKSLSYDLAS